MGWVFKVTPRPLYPQERPGTHCIGGWVGPQGRSGRVRKISPPTGTRSPDRPACSELLYQLSYQAHKQNSYYILIVKLHVSILYTDHYQVLYRNTTDRLYCLVSTVGWQHKWNKMKSCVSTHLVFVPTDRSTTGWQVIKVIYLLKGSKSESGYLIVFSFIICPSHSKEILGNYFKLWPPSPPPKFRRLRFIIQ